MKLEGGRAAMIGADRATRRRLVSRQISRTSCGRPRYTIMEKYFVRELFEYQFRLFRVVADAGYARL